MTINLKDKRIKDLEKRVKALQDAILEISRASSFSLRLAREAFPSLKKVTNGNGEFHNSAPISPKGEEPF